jgi:outer membrane receptor protein involved in Fe transport
MVGSLAACSLACAAPANAQEAAPPTTADAQVADQDSPSQGVAASTQAVLQESADGEVKAIVVTGSRIKRPNLESTVPITSVSGDSFIQAGNTNIGDALNDLPQLRSTFAQQNPGLGVGIAGLNLLDLRGLGTVRTLVVVNGRRHVGSDILNNATSVDINGIPADLIDRVDIVTGAQSSIYGSDAIAGVVNFVLKRDFNGAQIRGNFGVSEGGFGGNQYISGMYGHNFDEGRGNITVHGEYSNQSRVFGSDIKELRRVDGLVTIGVDTACTGSNPTTCDPNVVNNSNGIPDRTFFRDVRSATISSYGLVPITQITGGAAPCGVSTSALSAATLTPVPFNCNYVFDAQGRLHAQTGARVGTTINGSFVGGNGQTGREGEQLSILPKLERYTFNLLGHYEFAPAADVFVEAKWGRVNAQGSNASPSFTQGGTFTESTLGGASTRAAFQQRERIRIDNPFLNPADRAIIAAALLASDCDNTITGSACSNSAASATRLSPAEEAQIAAGTYRFVIGKRLLDLGIRDEKFQRDTWRVVTGLRGDFNDDWNYEVSVNYGKFKESTTSSGYLDRQKFLLSMDSGIDPAHPELGIQCRAQFDPTAGYPFQSASLNATQNAFINARLASDIAACVPYNPFGDGRDNKDAIKYFQFNAHHKAEMTQFVLQGFVSGDSSQLFELPGGPVRFSLGGEYRKEDAQYNNDPLVLTGATNAVVIGVFDPKALKVKELFGEIQLPILADEPFFDELTLTGAGRLSDYNTAVGTVKTYNVGLDWAPVRDIRFRAGYGRAVRAPNLSETGFPVVPNFAPGFADPCSGGAINSGSATRAANCLAELGPTVLANLATLGTPSLPVLSGSNPDLQEETSDSYTIGAVIQPRWIPGLSVSIDWWKINVNNVIVALGAQAIVNNCYDAPTLSNPFCPLFKRFLGTAPGPFGEITGQVLGNSLNQAGLNFASRERKGIDVNAAYRAKIGDVGLSTNLIYVHMLQSANFQDPANPKFENHLLEELGDPKDEFTWDTDLSLGHFTLGYRMRFIGKMYVNTYEDFNVLQGRPAENADYADIHKYPATFYHNIRVQFDLKNSYQFYAGVDNLLDTFPPLGLAGTGTGGAGSGDRGTGNAAIYDSMGRTFYAGFKVRY